MIYYIASSIITQVSILQKDPSKRGLKICSDNPWKLTDTLNTIMTAKSTIGEGHGSVVHNVFSLQPLCPSLLK